MGRPSQKTFEKMITSGKLLNNSVTVQDSRNAIKIYGTDLGVLKGKTTRKKTEHVSFEISEKPKPVNIILSIDVMYFTGLTFLTTVSQNIRFITATLLVDQKKKTIFDAIQQVIRIYKGKGHEVDNIEFEEDEDEKPIHTIMTDNEFKALKENRGEMGMNVHVVSKNEHVPEVERQNRVIKERTRAVIQTMPCKRILKKMRIALIQCTIFWLNNIPKEGQDQSPKEIIMGEQKLDTKYICKLPFGAYMQVHEDREITNTTLPRTTGSINLGPSNLKGEHKFLSLETGDIIMRRRWTEMPVPTDVIVRQEEMSSNPNNSLRD